MWNTIYFVAESRRIDAKALEDFALANQEKYGDEGNPQVNTWNVDQMIADFKLVQSNCE